MARHLSVYALVLCCLIPSGVTGAQTTTGGPSPRIKEPPAATQPPVSSEADLIAEARRATALSLVTALADEARDYRDETLRVRIQARAADALCEPERDRSLALFQRAWEAAESVDKAGEREAEEARARFLSGRGGPGFIPLPPNLRLEVLRFAARCDRELAEKFLATLEEEKKRDAEEGAAGANSASFWDPTEPPAAIAKRLELATLLVESGDVERALRFADPALARVTKPGIVFLYKLRQKDAKAADLRFRALVTQASADPSADANAISLLSSYAFTPLVFATVTRNGRVYGGEAAPPPALSADLRAAFFHTAVQVLLRPIPPPDQDRTSAGRAGTYFVIARLLPLFEQHVPNRVPELHAYLASLTPDAPESVRGDHAMLTAGFTSEAPAGDDTQAVLERARRAAGSAERDRLYISALRGITQTDPPRAREIADKIENPELRKRARAFVDFAAVRTALEKKSAEEALRIVRAGDLPPIQRVWAYTEVTRLLGKSDPARVLELLNEAAVETRRIDQDSPQRAQALTAVSTHFFDVDRPRAWETMAEAVKAAGRADDFIGEGGKVTAHLQTGSMVATFDYEASSFDLKRIFSAFAKDDLHRAIALARGFTGEEPRAIAILAIARSVLDEKQKRAAPQKQ